MSLDLDLVCVIPGLRGRQRFTTSVQSRELVGDLRARLPKELGLPPRMAVRLYDPATRKEFIDDAQTLRDSGILYVSELFVQVVKERHGHPHGAAAGDALLLAEIERLKKENEALREALRGLGRDVPAGKSLLDEPPAAEGAGGAPFADMDEEADGAAGQISLGGAGGGGFALDLSGAGKPTGGGGFALDLGGAGKAVAASGGFALDLGAVSAGAGAAAATIDLGPPSSAAHASVSLRGADSSAAAQPFKIQF